MECIPTVKSTGTSCKDGHPQRCECCESVTENVTHVFKEWLSPNEKCSVMRALLRPFFNTEFYQKYKHCTFERITALIGLFGAIIYAYSLYTASWKCELEECLCGNCSDGYKSLLLFLFIRGIVLNANGLIFSIGLFYGSLAGKPDFLYLWLLWKTIVLILNVFTLGLMGVMVWSITENARLAIVLEVLYLVTNFITWVVVYTQYEKVCSCLMEPGGEEEGGEEAGEEGGGGADDDGDMDEGGGFIMREYIIPANRMQNLNVQSMMGNVMPSQGFQQGQSGQTIYTMPGNQPFPPSLPPHLLQDPSSRTNKQQPRQQLNSSLTQSTATATGSASRRIFQAQARNASAEYGYGNDYSHMDADDIGEIDQSA